MSQWSGEDVTALLGELGSHGFGGINPDEQQLRSLLTSSEAGPLQFVNLLSYYAEARYPEGHELAGAGLSGAEAYARYGAVALEQVVRRGGQLTLYNDVLQVLIGRTGPWDQIAVMQYPEVDTFVDMIRDPDYRAGLVHRDAGLAATAILVSRPLL
ncbi:MAG: DUF1330 domain-containing protein [Acidimicrobiales bacterium]